MTQSTGSRETQTATTTRAVRIEPSHRRLRVRIGGEWIADTTRPLLMLEEGLTPVYYLPKVDVRMELFEPMMRSIRPCMNEFDVQEIVEHAYRTHGSRGSAFPTIAGSGVNSTVLHYCANDQPIRKGDLICVDSGATLGGYSADITRTVPVSGRFTKRQREVYEITLKAQRAAIQAIRPGVMFAKIDDAARRVIDKAGLGDFFIHGIGHHLGLQTHDASPDAPLRQGAVVTIEPGIYVAAEKIGIRIEDDLLVTKAGAKNVSAKIPKTVAAIEKLMG